MSVTAPPSSSPHNLPPLRDVIAKHGLSVRKSLGQHFLLDLNLTARIARAAGDVKEGTVIEIGPGPGGLTRALLDAGARVIAIERDARCIAALAEVAQAYPGRLEVIEGDALKIDVSKLGAPPRRIVSNLPYNIATPLLIGWLRHVDHFHSFTLMFQKEVADRLCAEPRSKAYGRLSIISQWLCETQPQFNVDKRAFTPPPKVASSVVTLTVRDSPVMAAPFAAMETVTAAAFGQRRKMLRSSLKSLGLDLEALEISPTARAEELSVEQFCRLARAVAQTGS
jgi:16S rRNA (adenine1518-N6/adenine1519-N6)-dimethyltransferase